MVDLLGRHGQQQAVSGAQSVADDLRTLAAGADLHTSMEMTLTDMVLMVHQMSGEDYVQLGNDTTSETRRKF